MSILGNRFSCHPNNDLVGMQSHMDELGKFLVLESHDDVQVVGIWGMGGIGKSTLAQELFHQFSHQYDASCYIDDVSKVYQGHGPLGVHRQLHCQVLNYENQEVWNLCKATNLTRTVLSIVKAFIVLDNVDEMGQLEGLVVNRELLCAGSKIIVVSRNRHILEQFGVDKIYQVQCLNRYYSRHLFCRKAFRSDYIMKEYEELTYRALEYAQGHPLAIKILGSFLLGRSISEWISALDRLRDDPMKDIMNVLRISFDGLGFTEKEIFLDIACFFNLRDYIEVKRILNYFGFHPEIGMQVLIDQSLITINQYGRIEMHDMLVELGNKIVFEKAPNEPRKWSRIWTIMDFQNITLDQTTNEDLKAIQLDGKGKRKGVKILRAEVLSTMSHLRMLEVYYTTFIGSLDRLSNKLQYLEWYKYPFTHLPSTFEPFNLVELILPRSNIKRLWEDTKHLHKLRIMNLRDSKNLIKTPDFRGLTNLEELNLKGCTKLVEVHRSIGLLNKLKELNLQDCTSLRSLPHSVFGLGSLEVLNLSGCSNVFKNQLSGNEKLAEYLKNDIVCLLLPSFQCLRELNLYKCNLPSIPDAIGSLYGLEKLNLGENNFVSLPSSLKELPGLKSLYLAHCKQLKYLPELTLCTDLLMRTRKGFVDYENKLPGLYIFNCPKLIEVESWSNIAVSWMTQFLKIHHKFWPFGDVLHCVVPGSQIPMWFENQSGGNSNTIMLDDRDWIGLALCAAFSGPAAHSFSTFRCTTHIIFTTSNERFVKMYTIPVKLEKDLGDVESDHMLLFYLPREALIEMPGDEYDLTDFGNEEPDFLTSFDFSGLEDGLVVKKWGFRWVFKQDLELEQLTPSLSNLSLQFRTRQYVV